MIHSGQPRITFIDSATRHIELRQGIMGVKVRIMLPYRAPGSTDGRSFGVDKPLPDVITFLEEKRDENVEEPVQAN